jgi:AcrR family transcriptional regulator
MTPAGRRPGRSTTASEILIAARELFARSGYQATTVRAIAERAGVNPALVGHFYGSKQRLFMAALEFPTEPMHQMLAALDEAPRDEIGERLVSIFVRAWRDPTTGQQLQAVFRSAATDPEGSMLARRLAETLAVPLIAKALGVRSERVAAVLAQLLGYAFLATIIEAEPLYSLDETAAVALLAPTVQRYLGGS